jgi:putative tryptophan/tyrosine transport system substrate-binding protein
MAIAIARRKFIALLGVAMSWPLAAHAQQTVSPVIGFLSSVDPVSMEKPVSAFHQGLDHMGFIGGRNVTVTYEWAKNQYDRLPALAQDLVRQDVSVIVTSGGEPAAFAASAATKTIPIVFNTNGDPVRLGLATSLRRPGGNLTGISSLETTAVVTKRFNLLRELLPKCQLFGLLANAKNVNTETDISEARADAQSKGQQLVVETVSDARKLDAAFTALAQQRVGGMLVQSDPFFTSSRVALVELAARYGIPAIYARQEIANAGGLISYGWHLGNSYWLQGVYAGRILKGERPAEMPIIQPTKFELVINLGTAKALAIHVPDRLLISADRVVQ